MINETEQADIFSRLALVCEAIAGICLLLMLALLAVNWQHLPESIPSHFAANGQPDSWGGRGNIFVMPALAVMMMVILTVTRHLPQSAYNYPVALTPQNQGRLLYLAREMASVLKASLMLTFLLLFVPQLQARAASPWLLPLTLALIFVPVIIYLILMVKSK